MEDMDQTGMDHLKVNERIQDDADTLYVAHEDDGEDEQEEEQIQKDFSADHRRRVAMATPKARSSNFYGSLLAQSYPSRPNLTLRKVSAEGDFCGLDSKANVHV